eukprot:CAMPEP_0173419184 /NCGR_PEP_ID=MMETSP1357-20121228/1117_1 /TAXON_ID=77926 /ORGANISM="Hemiselmis rufescens, Strain PCC563" /LENGTH=386 /DNA_ID=CAMNT_0014381787 /DNA_START=6 /DNA_END=1166 /DNA_ORIENTATION=+
MVKRSRDAGAAVKVGFVGWRGMVGSVLMERMRAENDFAQGFEATFYTTSNVGGSPPEVGLQNVPPLADATSVEALQPMDIVVTCQGGDYTKDVHPRLRAAGWGGLWIDAASALRMKEDAVIVLDPVNMGVIEEGLKGGVKDYIGGNCTVSLMLMALGGLFQKGWVEWATSMTYQAASGAGAKNMRELVAQMGSIAQSVDSKLMDDRASILDLDRSVSAILSGKTEGLPTANFGAPLAGSLIPWIDAAMENGQTKEEWKGQAETNKILGNATPVPIDGTCVRIGAMRCHSQAITIKLKKAVPLAEIEKAIGEYNEWSVLVPNTKEATLKQLSPAYVSGTLLCPVGRVRKLNMGEEYLSCFTVGDQLLWGAAEPVRRMLNIALKHIDK